MARLTGARALIETLVSEGVEMIFGNPGTTELALMHALRDEARLRYVLVLQEAVAVGMADGYARASGKVPFVNLHTVPGLANGLSVLYNLHYGGSPLVLTAGSQDSRLALREPWLSGDLVSLARPLTKWSVEVQQAAELPRVLHRAFKVAAQPPQGPVFISLPQDVLMREEEIPLLAPTSVYERLRPDTRALESAAAALTAARAPLVLVGGGVDRVGAHQEVVPFAERLGAPVYTTWITGLQFPTDHPLWGGVIDLWTEAGRDLLHNADLVFAIGTEVFQQMGYHERPLLAEGARLVHLHDNPAELGKNEPSIAVQGDVREALCELLPLFDERLDDSARRAAEARRAEVEGSLGTAREARRARLYEGWDERPIRVGRLMSELLRAMPSDAVLVDDAITSGGALKELVSLSRPGSYYNTRGGGSLGWGIGSALGVALAQPGREVVAVLGDGTALMVIQGLWSAAEHRLPVKFVLCNNASYRILKLNAQRLFGEAARAPMPGMDFDQPRLDFVQISEGFGVPASRVEDPAALPAALRELFALRGPALLDVAIDSSV